MEELELHLINVIKGYNKAIEESFEGIPFSMETNSNKEISVNSVDGENLGSAVVDKILLETREEVESFKAKNFALSAELLSITSEKEALTHQIENF